MCSGQTHDIKNGQNQKPWYSSVLRIILVTVLVICTALVTGIYWLQLPFYTNNFNTKIGFFRNKTNVDQYVEQTVVNNLNVYTPPIHKNNPKTYSSAKHESDQKVSTPAKRRNNLYVYTPANHKNDQKVYTPAIHTKSFNNTSNQHLDLKTKAFTTVTELVQTVSPDPNEHKDSQILDRFKKPLKLPKIPNKSKTTHVAFLKVHKAGSSTMQNLFFRFGVKHNLNILLPKDYNLLLTKSYQMQIEPTQHYDIFACHTIYSSTLFNSLLPADSVKIGIVREPVSRMISAAYYYRDVILYDMYLTRIPRAAFIHNLVRHPEKYDRYFFSDTRNTMGRDFGFSNTIKQSDRDQIHQYLNQLNSEFLLVLTVERMDESLVLMRRLLHWSISDIIYLRVNKHGHSAVLLTEGEKAKFKNTSFLDFEIYDFFKTVLDKKLQYSSREFWEEVKYFKLWLGKISEFCKANSSEEERKNTTLTIVKSAWNDSFDISGEECKWMSISEVAFINKLRIRHRVKHNLNS